MTPRDVLTALAASVDTGTGPAPSPCVSVCRMDDRSGLCLGCFRTIEEIIAWGRQGDREHRKVWLRVIQRAGLAPALQTPREGAP